MSNHKAVLRPRLTSRFHWRNTGQYFLRGILVIAPVLITLGALYWVFIRVDGLLQPYVTTPGIGLALLLFGVVVIGWISSFHFIRRSFRVVDHGLVRMPGISFIYSSVRDFLEAFVGRKRRFTRAVAINVFGNDVWLAGFLTDEGPENFDFGAEYVSVYVPQAYNVGGQLYFVKRDRLRFIEHLTPADVMKYAVTGGAVEVVDKDA